MDPITAMLLIGGISAGAKAGYGVWQRAKARKMERASKGLEGQQVSSEYTRNLADAQRMAREGLPEQVYQNQLNQINAQTASAARGLTMRRNTAGQLNNAIANTNRATMGLNASDAAARRANQQGVLSARQIIAQAKQRSYDIEQQAIAALRGAGSQNIIGGFDTAASTAMAGLSAGAGGTDATGTATPKRKFTKMTKVNPYYPINGIGNNPYTTQNIG